MSNLPMPLKVIGAAVGTYFTAGALAPYFAGALGGTAAAGAAGGAAAGTAGAAAGGAAAGGLTATQSALLGLGTSAAGALVSRALAPRPGINIPPPPGAATIDPAASQAAARMRRQQATAGGFGQTVLAGGNPNTQGAYNAATGGQKTLLGS